MIKFVYIKSIYGFISGEIYHGHFDKDFNFHAFNNEREEYICTTNEWSEIFQKK